MLDRHPVEGAAGADASVAAPAAGARARAEDALRWAAVALGCSIPISVFVDNVLLAVILVAWLAGGAYREKFAAIRGNPVALATLAVVALYFAGTLYTVASGREVLNALSKAIRLLLIPALIPLMCDGLWRRRCIASFLVSMLITLALSYLLWLDLIPPSTLFKGTHLDPSVFKGHITHNVFMAYSAYLFALLSVDARTPRSKFVYALLCALATANVLVMVPGRTGHVVLLVLFTYFLYRRFRGRGLVAATVALGALLLVVAASPDTMLHKRFTLADDELQQWRAGVPPDETSSVGQRLEFVRNTLSVIRDNPLLGVGTGGFATAYNALAARTGDAPTTNPHNEFLMTIAQFGIVGLVLILGLFGVQWWIGGRLPDTFEQGAARGYVLAVVVSSLFSSTLLDHAEAMFFVYIGGTVFAGFSTTGRRVAGDLLRSPNASSTARIT